MPTDFPTIEIEAVVLKSALKDLKKFLGTKPGPVRVFLNETGLKLSQSSIVSSAMVDLDKDKFKKLSIKGNRLIAIDSDMLSRFVSKAAAKSVVTLIFKDMELSIQWGNVKGQIALSSEDGRAPSIPRVRPIVLSDTIMAFAREHSSILKMKSYFSNKSMTATLSIYNEKPVFMVNDDYHGLIVIGPKRVKPFPKFSLDSAAMSAIVFDPFVSNNEKASITVTEGRVFIKYSQAEYEIPSFETTTVPTQKEISELIALTRSKRLDNKASFNINSIVEVSSVTKGNEEISSFEVLRAGKSQLKLSYSSQTLNSSGVVHSNINKWKKSAFIDSNMFREISERLIDLNKKAKKDKTLEDTDQVTIFREEASNIILFEPVLNQALGQPKVMGFMITAT